MGRKAWMPFCDEVSLWFRGLPSSGEDMIRTIKRPNDCIFSSVSLRLYTRVSNQYAPFVLKLVSSYQP